MTLTANRRSPMVRPDVSVRLFAPRRDHAVVGGVFAHPYETRDSRFARTQSPASSWRAGGERHSVSRDRSRRHAVPLWRQHAGRRLRLQRSGRLCVSRRRRRESAAHVGRNQPRRSCKMCGVAISNRATSCCSADAGVPATSASTSVPDASCMRRTKAAPFVSIRSTAPTGPITSAARNAFRSDYFLGADAVDVFRLSRSGVVGRWITRKSLPAT